MNPVVIVILIFSSPKQSIPYIFNTEINMQTLTDLYCYFYPRCYLENVLMCA